MQGGRPDRWFRCRTLILFFVLVFVLVVALSVSTQAFAQRLVVSTWDTERVLLELDLSGDPHWEVRWNHSVAGFLVRDLYRYEGDHMLLTATHTPDFAAGLGHIPERGRLESDGKGGYWIREMNEAVPGNRYLLRVGSKRVDHRIFHAGVAYSLNEAAGERVVIAVLP